MIVAAHGNDGMGSIRIPSACCGLVGIKPGLGVVPAELGNGSWFDMAENGPLATTVADCALLLSVLAGRPELAEVDEPSALRIAVSTRNPIQGFRVDRSWADAAPAAGGIAARGRAHRAPGEPAVRPADRPVLAGAVDGRHRTGRPRCSPTGAGCARRTSGTPPPAGSCCAPASRRTQGREPLAPPGRGVLRRPRRARHAGAGAVTDPRRSPGPSAAGWPTCCPTCGTRRSQRPWNVAGWPAIAVPTGVGADGMPRAVQLVGRPGSEATLLGLAAQIEQRRPWQRVAPG